MSTTTSRPHGAPGRVVRRPDIPFAVRGRHRAIKTALASLLLGIYFLVPWLRWDRGPALPDQAVLFDLGGRRLLLFDLELWPQDLPIALGVLIAAALGLFWATTLSGRVWCGYACPQTVWSDLFFGLNRLIQRLSGREAVARPVRPVAWALVALATAVGFVTWFTDVTALTPALFNGPAPAATYVAILVLTATTWLFAAHLRERICLHMCPWPRFQAALLDPHSLVVTYRAERGEPRNHRRAPLRADLGGPPVVAEAPTEETARRGDCIDCTRCVTVCPTGVDIRNGLQMGCIGCGLCIDACNTVMDVVGRPPDLIRMAADATPPAGRARVAWARPKAMLFAGGALLALSLSLYGLLSLPLVSAHAEPQRDPPFVQLSDGGVRNDFALRLSHRAPRLDAVRIAVEGLPGALLARAGQEGPASATLRIPVGTDRSLDERLLLTLPRGQAPAGRAAVTLVLSDDATGDELGRAPTYAWGPEP